MQESYGHRCDPRKEERNVASVPTAHASRGKQNKTKQNPALPWAGKLSAHREAEPVCSHPAGHWEEGARPVTNSFHGVSRLKSQPGMKPHASRCV